MGNGFALQVARNLAEVNHTLNRVAIYLLLIAFGFLPLVLFRTCDTSL